MSDRPCNKCDFKQRKTEAKKRGTTLKVSRDKLGSWNGIRVVNGAGKFVVWYAQMPEKCEC